MNATINRYAAVHTLGAELASELSHPELVKGRERTGWKYDRRHNLNADQELHWSAQLDGPNGEELHVSLDGDKAVIRGTFKTRDVKGGYFDPHPEKRPEIKVTAARGPVVIAREIKRRLLPDYIPAFARVAARLQEHNNYIAERRSDLEVILAELDTPHAEASQRDNKAYGYIRPRVDILDPDKVPAEISVEAEIYSTINLELRSLSVAQTVAVLKFIKAGCAS